MTPIVRLLIAANVGMFLLQNVSPALAEQLVFFPPLILQRPWSPLSYMFLHGSFTHILFNMLGLFFFGPRIEMRLGSGPFATLYFISGLSGALLSALLSPTAPIIGASAGVFGVMLAFAFYWPHEPIYIWGILPVPARVLVIITTIGTLWAGFTNQGGIAHFAHLGGYLGAFLYLKWLGRGKGAFRKKVEAAPPLPADRLADWKAIDRSTVHALNREELDRILDKINAKGVGSLTPQERIFLSNFVSPEVKKMPS